VQLLHIVSTSETIQGENYLTLEHGPQVSRYFSQPCLEAPPFSTSLLTIIDLHAGQSVKCPRIPLVIPLGAGSFNGCPDILTRVPSGIGTTAEAYLPVSRIPKEALKPSEWTED
jgi:hypothetical protein